MKDDTIFIEHILDSISKIEEFTNKMSELEFKGNILVQSATIRMFEVIGEAVKNLSPTFRETHKNVPWRKISGLRDILIHQYFDVDLELVWDVVKSELPWLKKAIKELK